MKQIKKRRFLLLLIIIGTMFIGIGYASINSITGEITGTVLAEVQSGVFITDVEYVSDIEADMNISRVENFIGTTLNNTVGLSETNPNSQITYKVTVYNNSEEEAVFVGPIYDEEFYSNPNIEFEISGFTEGEIIGANESREIIITFKYKNETIPEETTLSSYINLKFSIPNRLRMATNVGGTGKYLNSAETKNSIEKIAFKLGQEPNEGIISRFDASEKEDESIIGYYTDIDNNNLYELTFVSEEMIFANKNAQYLFQNLTNLTSIEFDNFSTIGTTSMLSTFQNCKSLPTLDLSKIDTSNVTNMGYMFNGCSGLTTLDVSEFNTSSVTAMERIFSGCSGLTTLDVSKFNTSNVTNMSYMFNGCNNLSKLDVSKFDTSNVTNMQYMFANCNNLSTIGINNWDTSSAINMAYMFRGCSGLTTLDVSKFNTNNVTNIQAIFYGCSNLTTIDVSNWNTSNVTSMRETFADCEKVNNLDVSNWDTRKSNIIIFNI